MADTKWTDRSATTTPATTDILGIVVTPGSTPLDRKVTVGNLYKGLGTGTPSAATLLAGDGSWKDNGTKYLSGSISNPQADYAQSAHTVLFQAPFALTITKIHISGPDATPTAELAGDLKFADDTFTGVLANATVIDVCDTTSGVFTATSFDDATVPANKYIYFQYDASPHADWTKIFIQIHYTVD